MPAKKKGSKAAKPKAAKPSPGVDDQSGPTIVITTPELQWITLSVRLVTWGYLNFSVRVPLRTKVIEIRDQIVARHGGSVAADEVRIYKEDASQGNMIYDLMLTLEELDITPDAGAGDEGNGINSTGVKGGVAEAVLFYDFKPVASECPLLLAEPPNHRYANEMKRAAAAAEEKRLKEEQRLQRRETDKAAGTVRSDSRRGGGT